MDRITKQNIERRTEAVNRLLSGVRVVPQGRNGYVGLDLYAEGEMVRNLTVGSKREVYDYMGGMLAALELRP